MCSVRASECEGDEEMSVVIHAMECGQNESISVPKRSSYMLGSYRMWPARNWPSIKKWQTKCAKLLFGIEFSIILEIVQMKLIEKSGADFSNDVQFRSLRVVAFASSK